MPFSATAVTADVATAEGCVALISAAAAGGADIFLSSARTGSNETIADAPDQKCDTYWHFFVMAAVRLSRGLPPQMEAKGAGDILMNALICAVWPFWQEPLYNTAKAAHLMFGKCPVFAVDQTVPLQSARALTGRIGFSRGRGMLKSV